MQSARTRPNSVESREVLRDVFGHDDFRYGQADAVNALVDGQDAVVLLPTGAGKSLCYQVPALVARRRGQGTTVVVSPLIALMQDQVDALCGRGVAAAAINSSQDEDDQREVVISFLRGELDLLYVSPERAALASFRRMLDRVQIAAIAIDEAHCLSQWGHDFRPEYMRLCELRQVVDVPTIALTATATPQVMEEIVSRLELRDPTLVRGDFSRPNLSFSVQHLRSESQRITALIELADELGFRANGSCGRAIVYCATRKKTETVAKALRSAGISAGYYHAGRTKLARERAKRSFDVGRTNILVATNAFGMGIDYPDVRLIVHFQTPGSVEAYYQEAGRAGRDGLAARCVLYFGEGDLVTQRRLQSRNAAAVIEQRGEAALGAVRSYAFDINCRQRMLSEHFTGKPDHPECGTCDVCSDAEAVSDALGAAEDARPKLPVEPLTEDAKQTIVDAVDNLRKPVGRTNLAKALRGSNAKALRRYGLHRLPQHGALKEYNEPSIVAAVEELLSEKRLERKGRKYPTVWMAGKPVRGAKAAADGTAAKPKRKSRPRYSSLIRELDNYRKRQARALKWKAYMVFQRRAIVAIDAQKPRSRAALEKIPGLGPAKIQRFGDDILDMVRRNA